MDAQTAKKKALRVLIFGVISNFSIGILYTWSNLKDILEYRMVGWENGVTTGERLYKEWDISQLTMPYAIGGFVSALIVLYSGSLQDRIGPTKVIIAGILMVGGGTILCSFFTHSPYMFTAIFTLLVGNGIGFVYACPRPAAMKWFHPSKKGMINGVVVAGFGLGALWLGPLEIFLLKKQMLSLETTLVILGCAILAMGLPAAINVVNPPEGYKVPELKDQTKPLKETQMKTASVGMKTTIRTPQAWMLFMVYAFYCSAGALVISNSSDIMKIQSGGTEGPYGATVAALLGVMVPIASISNATGRSLGGILSDNIGRKNVYYIIHTIQAINMFFFHTYTTPTLIIMGVIITCVAYGSVMSTTPSIVADYFGLKAYGGNYGIVYTGWGLSLVIGPTISSFSKKLNGNYDFAYQAAIVLVLISLVIVYFLKKPKFRQEDVIDDFILAPEDTKQ